MVRALDLSEEVVRYYARYVERAQVFQVRHQADKKYRMVLCFLVYQYYQVGDLLTKTLLQALQTHRTAAQRETQECVCRQQQGFATQLRERLDGVVSHGAALAQLEDVVFSFARTNEEKVEVLLAWLQTPDVTAFAQLRHTAQQLRERGGGSASGPYYRVVEERSRTLQRRLGEILRRVAYEGTADSPLAQALGQYRARDGQPGSHPPTGLLKPAERAALAEAASPVSLSKALLAGHVADHLKAGKLNLAHSLRYRPFGTYLLDATTWATQRAELPQQTNLTDLRESGPFFDALQTKLATAFARTFDRLAAGTNPGVKTRADGRPRFLTPAQPVDEEAPRPRPLFPGPGLISLHEVLHTVNQACRFTECLEHWSPRNRPPRPAERVFFAGIMAYGCNLGLTRMAHATKHVAQSTPENTVNRYFSLENLRRANDAVVALTGKLPVSRLFRRDPNQTHTFSDGQKYYVAVDSIHATYFSKYFGQEKGIVSYGFLDNRHRLFHSVTISAFEREAAYLVDGLSHNDVVESTVPSTDTHGFIEVNFAVTYLIQVAFAPRIQSFQDQQHYAFAGMDVPDGVCLGPGQAHRPGIDGGRVGHAAAAGGEPQAEARDGLCRAAAPQFLLPAPPRVLGLARAGPGRAHRVPAPLHGRPGPAQAHRRPTRQARKHPFVRAGRVLRAERADSLRRQGGAATGRCLQTAGPKRDCVPELPVPEPVPNSRPRPPSARWWPMPSPPVRP